MRLVDPTNVHFAVALTGIIARVQTPLTPLQGSKLMFAFPRQNVQSERAGHEPFIFIL